MSERAEQKALEAFPRSQKYSFSQRLIINDMRDGFIQGYEQAEKDTIERAVKWLDSHAASYTGLSHMFRKYMEEE